MKIQMFVKSVSDNLKNATTEELRELAQWCLTEADNRDPVKIALRAEQKAVWDKYYKDQEAKANHRNVMEDALRKLLKPGMRLKMKGCKDGYGVREFIRWDGKNIVCWQIEKHALGYVNKRWEYDWQRGNTVTTHMADKVQGIFVDEKVVPIKNFLK